MKLVGSDGGAFEKEGFVDSVVISPSERSIIEVLFDREGAFDIKNINPLREYSMGKVFVAGEPDKDFSADFYSLRENKYAKEDIAQFKKYFKKDVDAQFKLTLEMMHRMPMMFDSHDIEWEDTMGMMNAHMTDALTKWIIEDSSTGKQNMDISMKWNRGDKIKIRLFNDPRSMHPMQHPIHFHGQRFLVLNKDGVENTNLVWKDTVLVPAGSTIDILLDAENPGAWMAHCHIAEHLSSGMMMEFVVA
jgi:FtsP/CotA-like multicopper oxidase with cupredoxin domain